MLSQHSGTSSTSSRYNRRGRRLSLEATLVRYVSALRESLEEMTAVEEVLIDRVNYLFIALEDCFREINLIHQRLNILVVPPPPPPPPTWPQEDWNLANEVIQPTGWDEMPLEPPINATFEVPINLAPLPQEEVDEEPFIFPPREIEEMLNNL
ncbi:hypothetical protein Hanom_Chr06g00496961 [Helianthus anomalus]